MSLKLTKVFQKVPEGYIGFVEELPGANTQGDTLEEARANLDEAIVLVLEANRALSEERLQGQDVIRESVSLSAAWSGKSLFVISKRMAASSFEKVVSTPSRLIGLHKSPLPSLAIARSMVFSRGRLAESRRYFTRRHHKRTTRQRA